ncbi:MAG TPA: hypothetical protein VMY87_01865 [Armatimonadota bacterium]|nr:hypothetical protein [Armatimonadota bacterium]
MVRRISVILVVMCWALVGASTSGWTAGEKLLIVVLDKVMWGDLVSGDVEAPALRGLAEGGAVGLMCVRSGRGFGGEYVTIGAGSRAASRLDPEMGCSAEGEAFQATEVVDGAAAARVYQGRTGWPAGDNAIVHLGIGELLRENAEADYPLRLGLLGGELRRSGIRIACVGNADTLKAIHRELVCIGMDEQGLVETGSVGGHLVHPDPSVPYRVTGSPAAVLSAFRGAAAWADVVVLDLGETSRVEGEVEHMTPTAAQAARKQAIERADRLLGRALESLPGEEWAALVLTPTVRAAQPEERFAGLTPIMFSQPGASPGLLTSPSTRRPGLVVNTDVAPTILDHFGIELPPEIIGRPMAPAPNGRSALAQVAADAARHDALEGARRQLFRAVPISSAVVFWIAALFLLVGERVPRALRLLVRGALLILLSAPAAMLLVALRPLSTSEMMLAVVGLSLAIGLLSSGLTGGRSGHVVPALLVAALLAYDLVRGQHLLYWSPFSYSPAAGARFYGIGNEYAGVLLGAGIMGGASMLWPRERSGAGERTLVGLVLLALAALVAVPRFGANLGMSLAFGVGAAIFLLYLWREEPGWPEVIGALMAAGVLVAAAVALDFLLRGADASHIGRWVAAVRTGGWESLWAVLARKLSMNWWLVRVSLWTDAAAAALGVLGVAVVARPPRVLAAARERRWLVPSLIACFAGCAAAFALNDSGIVAAALALLYAAGSLAYVSLGDVGLED